MSISNPTEGPQLLAKAIRDAHTVDTIGGLVTFTVKVISPPIFRSAAEVAAITGTPEAGSDQKTVSKGDPEKIQQFQGRIESESFMSPHLPIPDPCNLSIADSNNAQLAFAYAALHTTCFTPLGWSDGHLKVGDRCRVTMRKGDFKMDLQYATVDSLQSSYLTVQSEASKNECSTLASLFEDFSGTLGDIAPTSSLSQEEVNAAMNEFFAALKPFMSEEIQKTLKISGRSRTTEEGRKMIYRIAKKAKPPVATKYTSEQEFAKDPAEVERVRGILLGNPYLKKIARPEDSNHNPLNGIIAFDIQAPGQTEPSYSKIIEGIERFMKSPELAALEYSFYGPPPKNAKPYVKEPTNGTKKCGSGLCGVVHINIIKKEASPPVVTSSSETVEDDIETVLVEDQEYPVSPTSQ